MELVRRSPARAFVLKWVPPFVLAIAAVILVLAVMNSEPGQPPAAVRDVAVEQQFPEAGNLELRQTKVGVDLTTDYIVESLEIDRVLIPEDQLERVTALNQVLFTPGVGTATGALAEGRHCARARFYPISQSPSESRSTQWCFFVH